MDLLNLVVAGIALFGFYFVIRFAVRDGILEADRRRARAAETVAPVVPEQPRVTDKA